MNKIKIGNRYFTNHEDVRTDWMKDPEFRKEYDALEEEFQLIEELIKSK